MPAHLRAFLLWVCMRVRVFQDSKYFRDHSDDEGGTVTALCSEPGLDSTFHSLCSAAADACLRKPPSDPMG